MPAHGHGISGEPLVTEVGDGTYTAVFAFSMSGTWEVTISVDGSAGADSVTIPYDVP